MCNQHLYDQYVGFCAYDHNGGHLSIFLNYLFNFSIVLIPCSAILCTVSCSSRCCSATQSVNSSEASPGLNVVGTLVVESDTQHTTIGVCVD